MGNIKTNCEKSLDNLQNKFKTKVNKFHEGTVILEYAKIDFTTVAKGMWIPRNQFY